MASVLYTPFANLLRQHRLAAGLTQEALADQAGLSVHGIQKLEDTRLAQGAGVC